VVGDAAQPPDWTPELRQAQREVLTQARALEEQALATLEQVVP
jgi:hypothetical protein